MEARHNLDCGQVACGLAQTLVPVYLILARRATQRAVSLVVIASCIYGVPYGADCVELAAVVFSQTIAVSMPRCDVGKNVWRGSGEEDGGQN